METRAIEENNNKINPNLSNNNKDRKRFRDNTRDSKNKASPDHRSQKNIKPKQQKMGGKKGSTTYKKTTSKKKSFKNIQIKNNPNKNTLNKKTINDYGTRLQNGQKNNNRNKSAVKSNQITQKSNNEKQDTIKISKNEKTLNNKNITAKKKSISVDIKIYEALKRIRDSMSEQLGGRITFNIVVQSLLNDHYDLENTRSELKEIQKQTEETTEYIKEMLKLALVSNNSGINGMMPVGIPNYSNAPINTNNFLHTPPPAPPRTTTTMVPPGNKNSTTTNLKKIKSSYKAPNTGNVKKDYLKEIKQIFKGEFLKPSDILSIAKPAHKNSKIDFLDEDVEPPDIFENSVANKFKNPEESSEQNV